MSKIFNTEHDVFLGAHIISAIHKPECVLAHKERFYHTHILGRPGSGKSNLILHKFIQDVHAGHGAGLLDPHGDLAEQALAHIPGSRLNDVVYVNPGDFEHVLSINPLYNVPSTLQSVVVSDIIETLRNIWPDSWGARMEDVLRNTLFALIEQPVHSKVSLASIPRFLTDARYRNRLLEHVSNPQVKDYFLYDYGRMNERFRQEVISPVMNKIRAFLSDPIARNMLSPAKPTFDIYRAMNDGRIVIINLAQARIGSKNALLLGSFFVSMIRMSAQARVELAPEDRRPFFLYVDEVQKFMTDDFVHGFAEVRKSKLAYIIAHQYRTQLKPQLLDAVKETVGTFIAFSLGIDDAEYYAPTLHPIQHTTLTTLEPGQAIARVSINGSPVGPIQLETILMPHPEKDNSAKCIRISREHFTQPVAVVEARLKKSERPHHQKFKLRRF